MMRVRAVKINKDIRSTKMVYEKNGHLYMRTGDDMFKTGKKLIVPLKSLLNKYGFKQLDEEPSFRDAGEIIDNLHKFEVDMDGNVSYNDRGF